MSEPVLCYVEGAWAYFTTQTLDKQWGDDWNDAPYEHNAGEPYWPRDGEDWRIVKVAWEGPFEPPCSDHHNSPYSVEAINRGEVAWLRPNRWIARPTGDVRPIPAGTLLSEFVKRITAAGGRVYQETTR